MSNLDFIISCMATFFSKKKTSLQNLNNGKYSLYMVNYWRGGFKKIFQHKPMGENNHGL